MTRDISIAEMDAIFPPLLFSLPSHTTGAPDQVLPILISKLMISSSAYDATYLFMVLDGAATSGGVDNMAVLGNSFLSHIVVVSDQGAKKMTLTPVNSCGDVKY